MDDWRIHCGEQMHAVEYSILSPQHYDGVSEWRCPVCGIRLGRWTGNILQDGEVEPRYGKGSAVANNRRN